MCSETLKLFALIKLIIFLLCLIKLAMLNAIKLLMAKLVVPSIPLRFVAPVRCIVGQQGHTDLIHIPPQILLLTALQILMLLPSTCFKMLTFWVVLKLEHAGIMVATES